MIKKGANEMTSGPDSHVPQFRTFDALEKHLTDKIGGIEANLTGKIDKVESSLIDRIEGVEKFFTA